MSRRTRSTSLAFMAVAALLVHLAPLALAGRPAREVLEEPVEEKVVPGGVLTLEELYNPVLSPEWSAFSKHREKIRIEPCPGRYTELPQLRLEGSWRSKHKRLDTDISAVTQSSMSRLSHIEISCRTWSGVIAAAIYVPLTSSGKIMINGTETMTLDDAKKELDALHESIEKLGTCKLDMALYSEDVESEQQSILYPVNALRNRALMLAETEIILLLDVDFLVSEGVNNPKQYASLLRAVRQQEAIVLPAFEPIGNFTLEEGQTLALKALKGGKHVAAKMYNESILQQFHLEQCDFGHKPTNYSRWITEDNQFYEIQFEMGFEPYVLTARELSPWYDERFRGYFRNKALQLRHLWTMGTKFTVHPTAFTVHFPHPNSGAAVIMRQTGMLKKIRETDTDAKVAMSEGHYTPATVFSCVFGEESEEPED